jgi:MFS family permease
VHYHRNIRLAFVAAVLRGIALGITSVIFSLYIVSLGISADVLGRILSAAPYAQALGSIPAGFIAEVIGYRYAYIAIFSSTGVAQIVEASTPYVPLIFAAAFLGGLGFAGDFVVRLPFLAANTEGSARARVFSSYAIFHAISTALGALLAGYGPTLLLRVVPDLTLAYRYMLYFAGALTLSAVIPSLMMGRSPGRDRTVKLSLAPYLWGMDRFTLQQAIISLLVGLSVGVFVPFLSLFFVFHLGTTREFYGIVVALAIVPNFLAITVGPSIAARVGSVGAVTLLRALIPVALVLMTLTVNPWIGAIGFWAQLSLFMMSQPLSFAFAMDAAHPKRKQPAAAWLNVTFWLGIALATPIGGAFIARANYVAPLYVSSAMILLAALCNQLFFGALEARMLEENPKEVYPAPEREPG